MVVFSPTHKRNYSAARVPVAWMDSELMRLCKCKLRKRLRKMVAGVNCEKEKCIEFLRYDAIIWSCALMTTKTR